MYGLGIMSSQQFLKTRPTNVLLVSTPKSGTTWLKLFRTSIVDLEVIPSPRLLAPDFPYISFPESVTSSDCKIVFLCCNPKDVLVSFFHLMSKLKVTEHPPIPLLQGYELFCKEILTGFLSKLFSLDEVENGVPEKIMEICRFEIMKSLEVNGTGTYLPGVAHSVFFREGKVGDWKYHFAAEMD
ncbi:Sulfotransferase domain [Dillenia turbinata]|uniref:Sulfotransferase n=1 Tax=Dillenia turbinata TaxID=194707 RepID=A0AAN8YZN0_9MAGN